MPVTDRDRRRALNATYARNRRGLTVALGACTACGRRIALTPAGSIRRHMRGAGVCPGTGRIG